MSVFDRDDVAELQAVLPAMGFYCALFGIILKLLDYYDDSDTHETFSELVTMGLHCGSLFLCLISPLVFLLGVTQQRRAQLLQQLHVVSHTLGLLLQVLRYRQSNYQGAFVPRFLFVNGVPFYVAYLHLMGERRRHSDHRLWQELIMLPTASRGDNDHTEQQHDDLNDDSEALVPGWERAHWVNRASNLSPSISVGTTDILLLTDASSFAMEAPQVAAAIADNEVVEDDENLDPTAPLLRRRLH